MRPLLLAEAARRRRVEWRFVTMLESAGFGEVLLPIIDYAEPYLPLVDRDTARQSYRFIDREGDLVAIRSDFTPMVARALAPTLTAADLPMRVFYRGDVIRCEASRLGVNREIFQIGAEIIGDASVEADIHALLLAANSLASFGIRPQVVYSDASLAETLMMTGARTAAAREAIRTALLAKRLGELAPVRGELRDDAHSLIARLTAGTATIDDVAAYGPCADVADRLSRIGQALAADEQAAFVLHLDDIDDAAGYYTGLRFRIYGEDSRTRLAQGGRYDTLYARFGAATPAIGFTFTIDDIVEDTAERVLDSAIPAARESRR